MNLKHLKLDNSKEISILEKKQKVIPLNAHVGSEDDDALYDYYNEAFGCGYYPMSQQSFPHSLDNENNSRHPID